MREVDALAEWVAASVAVEGPLRPLPAEASTRRFFRVRTKGGTASYIAMHAPPATEDNPRFLRLARQFRYHGLATPEIHAFDADRGFVLMEDLGETDFASAYETHDVDALVNAAIDTLAALQKLPTDGIPPYESARFSDELAIFADWLIERFLGLSVPGDFAVTRQALIDATQSVPACVVHRDYHCRNLIWREDGTVGIVDFQDALVGPMCYDIASLLRDCYVEFAEEDVRRWRRRFLRVAGAHLPGSGLRARFRLDRDAASTQGRRDLCAPLSFSQPAQPPRRHRARAAADRSGCRDLLRDQGTERLAGCGRRPGRDPATGIGGLKAMILAAGRGERLRPLTERIPKPLIPIGTEPLIVHQLRWLHRAGIREVVINLHHLGGEIERTLGAGNDLGVRIHYSVEERLLDTGGGIRNALPILGDEPFVLLNGDIWTNYRFANLVGLRPRLAHLVLTPKPPEKTRADFHLARGRVRRGARRRPDVLRYRRDQQGTFRRLTRWPVRVDATVVRGGGERRSRRGGLQRGLDRHRHAGSVETRAAPDAVECAALSAPTTSAHE